MPTTGTPIGATKTDADAMLKQLQGKTSSGYKGDRMGDMDLNSFIKMLTAELQSQDPMEPMDNAQILQQVTQIRAVESNTRLTETLEGVALGQSVATGSSLLGKKVTGLSDTSSKITGKVDRVTVTNGEVKLHVGTSTMTLKNVGEILPS